MNPRLNFLSPPKTSAETIQSRRNPCYGFGIMANIEDKTALVILLTKIRTDLIKVIHTERTPDDHNVKSPYYIKQKNFHVAVFGHQPLLNKADFEEQFIKEPSLFTNEDLNGMCTTLIDHLNDDKPELHPHELTIMGDGTILARFRYVTNNSADTTPLLNLSNKLDPNNKLPRWDATNVARNTSVTIAITAFDKDNTSPEKIKAIAQILEAATEEFLTLGVQQIEKFNLLHYDKRTWSKKHIQVFAEITEDHSFMHPRR